MKSRTFNWVNILALHVASGIAGYIASLWKPIFISYLAMGILLLNTLIALELIEGWGLNRLKEFLRLFGYQAILFSGVILLLRYIFPNSSLGAANIHFTILCYLFGSWVGALSQALKSSMLVRVLTATCAIGAAPLYSAALAYISPDTQISLSALTLFSGGLSFMVCYGNSKQSGTPDGFVAWLRLNDQKS